MKKLTIILSLALIVSLFSGVGMAQDDDTLKIGMSFQQMNNPYFVVMKKAMKNAAKDVGAEVMITDAHHDINKQVNDVQDMIQKNIDVLLLNPTDTVGIQSAVKAAKEAGVVVIAVDAEAKGPVDAYVSSRNYQAGYKAGQYMAKELNEKGQVAILNGIPVTPILRRVEGFKDAISEYSNIEIVDNQNGEQERNKAMSVTQNMLTANPELDAIFSVNDTGALGTYSALKSSSRDVFVVSIDGHPEAVKAIQKGDTFRGTVAQFPRDMVRMGIGMGLAKYWGAERLPSEIKVPVKLINDKNAEGFSW